MGVKISKNEGIISNYIVESSLSINKYDELHEETKNELLMIKKEIKRTKWKNGCRRRKR